MLFFALPTLTMLPFVLIILAVTSARGDTLTQQATNGLSLLGTLNASTLPQSLNAGSSFPVAFPWGQATASNTNPSTDAPNTGVIRKYDFTISRGQLAPDGYLKDVVLINGMYPGPLIEANWGDTIQVTVHNNISAPQEGTSLHWHGFLQSETPWYDGVPSVQQCPIAPGSSFTYKFRAELYGTTWYHSHYSAQYAAGVNGPLIVYGPTQVPYDTDLGPVFINDWYHEDYFDLVKLVTQIGGSLTIPTPLAPNSDNNLINGKMNFSCPSVTDGTPCTNNAPLSKFKFQSGKTHRLRLINSGAEGIQKFSIDNHTLTVISNDFVPIQPYNTKIVTLGIGQRVDIIVKATGKPTDAVWMRSFITACATANQPLALAEVFYEKANMTDTPKTTAWNDTTDPCANDPLNETVPVYPMTPDPHPATTQVITISGGFNSSDHFNFFMNNVTFRADYNQPILGLSQAGNDSYPYDPNWNVYDFGSNKTIRFIVYNNFPAAHPMHMHGHNMYILATGPGLSWDGTVTNPSNPLRRDVQMLPAFSHMVVQIDADNPGVWPFHCHIAWHVSQGLYINILERPRDIQKYTPIPGVLKQTCKAWNAFSATGYDGEIDSGL
ncbi:MAG: hypothetical protein M1838_004201 [Thelocarpon superellum]|nr:MAG: hypothetical protein M1838_004201 [Thelocarpon superellum]